MILAQITNSSSWWATSWKFLSDSKDSFASVETIVKIIGILVAAGWAVLHFRLKREKYPRCALDQRVQKMEYSDGEWHLRVSLRIENKSNVLMKVNEGHTWVQQLRPVPDSAVSEFRERAKKPETAKYEAKWPLIAEASHNKEMEFEPGESSDVAMDFFVNKYFKQVIVYSFIKNNAKKAKGIGWTTSTTVNFEKDQDGIVDEGQGKGIDKARPENAKA